MASCRIVDGWVANPADLPVHFFSSMGAQMQLTRTSEMTGVTRTKEIDITQEQLAEYLRSGTPIQKFFPHLSDSDREFILTGITDEEWDTLKEPVSISEAVTDLLKDIYRDEWNGDLDTTLPENSLRDLEVMFALGEAFGLDMQHVQLDTSMPRTARSLIAIIEKSQGIGASDDQQL